MSKRMLINATHPEENRVAIVEDGILTELDIEIAGKEQTKGNIYKAAVVRVEPGLQAAFIDYGAERFGFLQMGEIHPSYFKNENGGDNRRPRITDVLRRGQELLVQVVKEERGTKGAALTTFLSLPGRYMVLMPESDTKGVSRKIEDDPQRKKLKEAMASLDLPANMGYIVRTAGIGQKKEELKRDFDYLVRVYDTVQEQARHLKAPALIYKESNLAIRSIRDYFSSDMEEVLVDDPKVAEEARDFFQQVMPEYARLVKLHQERRPIFSRYQIEEQIETITKNKVQLPSGGSIVIDPTEALVSVDVNSGKMAGEQGVESTAYKTNLEAAAEVARQLRLRDLGGLIVIDFIDMRERKHIREVEKCLKDSLKNDKARVTVGRISQFGLLEMSRQRIKAALAEGSFLSCPHCNGSGKVKSAEAQAIAFLRKIHAAVAKGQIGRVEGEVPLEVATYLLNIKREELLDMERRHQIVLVIKGRPDFLPGQAGITAIRREREDYLPDAVEQVIPAAVPVAAPPAGVPAPLGLTDAPPEKLEAAISTGPEIVAETPIDDTGKKKRKRRRKRKKTDDSGAALQPESTGGVAAAEEFEEETEEEESGEPVPPTAGEVSETAEAASLAGAEEKRKKRRRRRRKKPSSATEGGEFPIPVFREEPSKHPVETIVEAEPSRLSGGALPASAQPDENASAAPEERPVPARSRRRSRKKPEFAAAASGQAPENLPAQAQAPQEPPAPVQETTFPTLPDTPSAESIPETPKPRLPRQKTAAVKKIKEETLPPGAENETPKVPKRPSRRLKTAAPTGEIPELPADEAPAAEKKPKRPSRRKATEETPET